MKLRKTLTTFFRRKASVPTPETKAGGAVGGPPRLRESTRILVKASGLAIQEAENEFDLAEALELDIFAQQRFAKDLQLTPPAMTPSDVRSILSPI